MKATIEDVKKVVSVLTEEQQQLLKDTIRFGAWGDTDESFLNENGDSEESGAYVYITNEAKKGGHFTGRKIAGMFRSIYSKLCPKKCSSWAGIGEVITHCSDWWGDGSGDVLFIRDEYVDAFENWAIQ